MSAPATAPTRCGSCSGTGNGQTVCTGNGTPQPAPCGACHGSGQQ